MAADTALFATAEEEAIKNSDFSVTAAGRAMTCAVGFGLEVRAVERLHFDAGVRRPTLEGGGDLGRRDIDGRDVREAEACRLQALEQRRLERRSPGTRPACP